MLHSLGCRSFMRQHYHCRATSSLIVSLRRNAAVVSMHGSKHPCFSASTSTESQTATKKRMNDTADARCCNQPQAGYGGRARPDPVLTGPRNVKQGCPSDKLITNKYISDNVKKIKTNNTGRSDSDNWRLQSDSVKKIETDNTGGSNSDNWRLPSSNSSALYHTNDRSAHLARSGVANITAFEAAGSKPDRSNISVKQPLQAEPQGNIPERVPRDTKKAQDYAVKVLKRRPMQKIHKKIPPESFKFSVASYNVLAQNLLDDNFELYQGTNPRFLTWGYRRSQLVAEIKHYMPSVVCMQEVNWVHYQDFVEALGKLGYEGVYQKRIGDKLDGCATFFQTQLFDLVKHVPVVYYRNSVPSLDRDNVAVIVKLQVKNLPSLPNLVIANTHLLFNPRRGDVKLAQLAVLLAEIDKIAYTEVATKRPWECEYDPVIICGDLNSTPDSDIYKMLTVGSLAYEGLLQRAMSGQREGKYGSNKYLHKGFLPKSVNITHQCQYLSEVPKRFEHYKHTGEYLKLNDGNTLVDGDGSATNDRKKVPQSQISQNDLSSRHEGHCDKPVSSASSHSDPSTSDQVMVAMETVNQPPASSNSGALDAQMLMQEAVKCCLQSTGNLAHRLRLKSVYDHKRRSSNGQVEAEATTCHGMANCNVDYIFYSLADRSIEIEDGEVKVICKRHGPLKCIKRLALVTNEEMERVGPLPNRLVSSDHIMLLAQFILSGEHRSHKQSKLKE